MRRRAFLATIRVAQNENSSILKVAYKKFTFGKSYENRVDSLLIATNNRLALSRRRVILTIDLNLSMTRSTFKNKKKRNQADLSLERVSNLVVSYSSAAYYYSKT